MYCMIRVQKSQWPWFIDWWSTRCSDGWWKPLDGFWAVPELQDWPRPNACVFHQAVYQVKICKNPLIITYIYNYNIYIYITMFFLNLHALIFNCVRDKTRLGSYHFGFSVSSELCSEEIWSKVQACSSLQQLARFLELCYECQFRGNECGEQNFAVFLYGQCSCLQSTLPELLLFPNFEATTLWIPGAGRCWMLCKICKISWHCT